MSVWVWAVAAFLVGGLVGSGVTALLRRSGEAEKRLRRLQREYDQYQGEVARHFSQTGELLSRLRTAFDQLYSEVEERATALVAEEAMQRRLGYLDNDHRTPPARPRGGAAPQRPLGDDRAATPGFGGAGPEEPGGNTGDSEENDVGDGDPRT